MIYFVSTPIGNLKDITFRAIEVLSSVDVIACEDTRNSLKLLKHYNIEKKLIAYHKFNEQASSKGIVELHNEGKDIAIISDAGTPLISDPGYVLVKELKRLNIPYTVIAGANAILPALILSGLDTTKFCFIGFLPDKTKERCEVLENIKELNATLVFYVSPHNKDEILNFLYLQLGRRTATIVNEISKLYEKVETFVLGDIVNIENRGEFVLVVEGCSLQPNKIDEKDFKKEVEILLKNNVTKADAVKIIVELNSLPKNKVYEMVKNFKIE